jgi:N-acetylated-alpha-linked acidic dipeptidase
MNTAMLALLLCSSALAAPPYEQVAREKLFDTNISSVEQMAWLKQLSSSPNHVGSVHNLANAEFILGKFREWGWDASIEKFDVLYPTPISTTIELIEPERAVLGGMEPAIPEDSSSANLQDAVPPYAAYQGDGDVTAAVVYVNYGLLDDYKALERRGISVEGKIALARYGGGWRGLKPKLAQARGAVGTLIYSDPAGDGYALHETYPNGGGRPPHAVQRGSVADSPIVPGDPSTPGYASVPGTKRVAHEDAATIMKIPVLPIGYADATKILDALEGPVAPKSWRGALPLTYRMGGDDKVKVRLAIKSDWSLKPAYNVIAKLRGKDYPDEWVLRGNHHDAWVFGAFDPLAGSVAMLSEAKALGALAKSGWQPSRTIVYASWDAEEPGLLGSTEWVEAHADELRKKAIIYINTDGNARGPLVLRGSQEWQHLVNQVGSDVQDPETGVSVIERRRAKVRADAFDGLPGPRNTSPVELSAAKNGEELPLAELGSGSDYTPFLHHLGLPVLNIGYRGYDEAAGSFHSAYDTFDNFNRFVDPGVIYSAVLAKTVGRLVMRIADADSPPMRFSEFASSVDRYVGEVKTLAADQREEDDTLEALLATPAFELAGDTNAPVGPPPTRTMTPVMDFAALEEAATKLIDSAKAFDAAYVTGEKTLAPEKRRKLNDLLRSISQTLLLPDGLPGRSWYRHAIYAPGLFTGYGVKTLPGVREAIEERRFTDVDLYQVQTVQAIERYATRLDAARALLD